MTSPLKSVKAGVNFTSILPLPSLSYAEYLGSSLDRGSNIRHVELGDGIQAVVPRIKDSYLLWLPEREKDETNGVDQSQRIPRLHHFLQIGHSRSLGKTLTKSLIVKWGCLAAT